MKGNTTSKYPRGVAQGLYAVLLVVATLLTACTQGDGDGTAGDNGGKPQPIVFAMTADGDGEALAAGTETLAATAGMVGSRAGITGSLTNTRFKTVGAGNGFGVFAYYSNGADYAATLRPEFMYNQNVYYTGTAWTYSPLKYWPNETMAGGAAENDRLTFFAYAPYVELTTVNGTTPSLPAQTTWGITAVTGNTTAGDTRVTYVTGTTPETSVDLCWGVGDAGLPHRNLTKQRTTETVTFNFHHALARLRFMTRAKDDLPDGVTLTVNTVTITPAAYKATGVLNLNNTVAGTPAWESVTGTLGALTGTLNTAITTTPGVDKATAKPVFSGTDDSFMLIPATGNIALAVNYTITYDGGSQRTVNASHTIENLTLAAGNEYTLTLVIGTEEITLKATITPWTETTPVDAEFERTP